MTTKKPAKEPAPGKTPEDFAHFAEAVKDRAAILPTIRFPENQADKARVVVDFMEPTPRAFDHPNTLPNREGDVATSLAIQVRIVEALNVTDKTGQPISPGDLVDLVAPKDPTHGLTRGIASLWKSNGGGLLGIRAEISCAPYHHKKLKKKVRGYNVIQASRPEEAQVP